MKRSTKKGIWIIAGAIMLLLYLLLPPWMRLGYLRGAGGIWFPVCVYIIAVFQTIRSG